MSVSEPEPLVSRGEVVTVLFNIADTSSDVHLIRTILEEDGEEEED